MMIRNKIYSITTILILALTLVSCEKDDDNYPSEPFQEISDIATFHGNLNSKTAIIHLQGGPLPLLEDSQMDFIINFTQTQNALWVNLHQIQTKNPELFNNEEITFEQAQTHAKISIDYLEQVVNFFHDNSYDKVYVLGISYGVQLTQEYISQHGVDLVDGFLLLGGRLDMDDELWMAFRDGNAASFVFDSQGNYTIVPHIVSDTKGRNLSKLLAVTDSVRYTEELAPYDLTKVTYFSGTIDEAVGKMTPEEIQFLTDKNANLTIIPNGNHGETIEAGGTVLKDVFDIQ